MPNMTDYDETRASFSLEVPERFNAAADILDARADETPNKLALRVVSPDGSTADDFTYGNLRDRSNQMARALDDLGITKGDRIFVMLPRVVGWYDVILGAIKLGAIPMPASTQLRPKDIAYRINKSGATMAVTNLAGAASGRRDS